MDNDQQEPIFKDIIFALTGKETQLESKYKDQIEQHGGSIAQIFSFRVTFLIADKEEYEKKPPIIIKALDEGIPVVSRDFLLDSLDKGILLPEENYLIETAIREEEESDEESIEEETEVQQLEEENQEESADLGEEIDQENQEDSDLEEEEKLPNYRNLTLTAFLRKIFGIRTTIKHKKSLNKAQINSVDELFQSKDNELEKLIKNKILLS